MLCGILIGTVCLIGLIKTLRGGCGYGRGSCGGGRGGPWGRRRWGRHWDHDDQHDGEHAGWRESFFLRAVFERLDATPAQEKVISSALDELREAGRKARGEAKASRADVAKAMRAEAFDEVLFGEMFHRHDVAMEELRKAAFGALAKVHAVLDERQRARLADLIEQGPGYFRSWSRR